MPQSQPAPTRTLPARPSLAQLKKQAKELRKAYLAGEPAARAEVEHFERSPDPGSFSLADAQRVLARAYGCASWTELKQRLEALDVETFFAAVRAGNVAAVRRLARARPELVRLESSGESCGTALHLAVLNRDAGMTRVLMELGSDARLGVWPHRDATSATTLAAERGYDDILAVLRQEEDRRRQALSPPGAAVTSKTDEIHRAILQDRCGEAIRILESDPALIGACSVEYGLNQLDCRRIPLGATPLHMAAWKHNPEMTAWLLEHSAPVDAREAEGKTPLDYAAIMAAWSAHGRDFSFMENSHLDPARFHETVRLLRSRGAELTPRAAVATGDRQAVLKLHRAGRVHDGIQSYGGGLLSIAVRANRPEMVALLLDLGLDPDEPEGEGRERAWGAPLWFASMCGRTETAELLLAGGADVNAILNGNGDPFGCALRTGDETMQALLLRHGARIAVEYVSDRETAKAILDGTLPAHSLNVVDPTLTDVAEQMLWAAGSTDPEIVRLCLPHMVRRRDDPWWGYVLMHATLPASFKLILEHGVDPDVPGVGGHTPLHHLATAGVPEPLARATLLLDAGASLTRRDDLLKSTPLGWACRWGRADLVRLYLQRGADPREPDAEPWATPMAWATKGGFEEIVRLLQSQAAESPGSGGS